MSYSLTTILHRFEKLSVTQTRFSKYNRNKFQLRQSMCAANRKRTRIRIKRVSGFMLSSAFLDVKPEAFIIVMDECACMICIYAQNKERSVGVGILQKPTNEDIVRFTRLRIQHNLYTRAL